MLDVRIRFIADDVALAHVSIEMSGLARARWSSRSAPHELNVRVFVRDEGAVAVATFTIPSWAGPGAARPAAWAPTPRGRGRRQPSANPRGVTVPTRRRRAGARGEIGDRRQIGELARPGVLQTGIASDLDPEPPEPPSAVTVCRFPVGPVRSGMDPNTGAVGTQPSQGRHGCHDVHAGRKGAGRPAGRSPRRPASAP